MRVFEESVRKPDEKPCTELDSVVELHVCPGPHYHTQDVSDKYARRTSALTAGQVCQPTIESNLQILYPRNSDSIHLHQRLSLDPSAEEDTKVHLENTVRSDGQENNEHSRFDGNNSFLAGSGVGLSSVGGGICADDKYTCGLPNVGNQLWDVCWSNAPARTCGNLTPIDCLCLTDGRDIVFGEGPGLARQET
ncbi:unnamed protein product [Boreogadus saida]